MTKILLSLGSIVFVSAIAIGGTLAFYNDSETSTGNTFTAGAIDLTVDHLSTTYNGDSCEEEPCEPWADEVESFAQGLRKNGTPVNLDRNDPTEALGAAESTGAQFDNPVVAGSFVSLGFGGVIVLEYTQPIENGPGDDLRIYEVTGGNSYPDEKVKIEVSADGLVWEDTVPSEITRDDTVAIDTLTEAFFVRITDTSDPNIHNSSADGFDLDAVEAIHCTAGSGSYPSGDFCELWEEKDLDDEIFWSFDDIKPGDQGSNVISLHVEDNDAWTCLIFNDGIDLENTNVESEQEAGDFSILEGELSDEMVLFAWADDDNDGEYDPGDGEEALFEGPFSEDFAVPVHDTGTGNGNHEGGTTEYVGLHWCVGEQTVNHGTGDIDCDGSSVGNEAQTDSFILALTLYASQVRNDETFLCEDVDPNIVD